ncbi:MAG: L,D-transpeptidase [Deltaproteobacteria bacterium]|nr:L,D-transpeptidase [Deltaproteobacteria bacterium]
MVKKVRRENKRVKSPASNGRKRKNGRAKSSRVQAAVLPVVFVALGALGVWQCMGDDASSPLEPLKTVPAKVDVGNGRQADPTIVNESELLENAQLAKPSEAELEEAGEPNEERTIEAAGEELEEPEASSEAVIEDQYPMHAVAYHFHSQILEKPELDARVLAYARRGTTFSVSRRVSTKSCARGWHEIRGGGFICDGKGFNVAKEPVSFEPAPRDARLNEALPYDYRYIKRNGVAEFWKIPDATELAHAKAVFEGQTKRNEAGPTDRADEKKEDDSQNADLSKDNQLQKALDNAKSLASPAERAEMDSETDEAADESAELTDAPLQVDTAEGPEESDDDPLKMPPYVHLRMNKGYFVSVNNTLNVDGANWQQTIRGRYIDAAELYPANPSKFEGVLLSRQMKLPLAFVVSDGVRLLTQEASNGPLKNGGPVKRYDAFLIRGKIQRNNREYVEVANGKFIFKRAVGIASLVTPPSGVGEDERWVDVNLTEQTLVAYEGATPVFATLISSGRDGYETPKGEFRIYNKHVSITMDDPDAGEDSYSIEDVPWTQYFEEGFALHAAFWHDRFGRVRSHGCINLSPADARRLFFWTGPHLNEGMHGVFATAQNPGTRVVIHD